MSRFRVERVLALPSQVTPSTMYVVRSPEAGLAELYFSNNDGTDIRKMLSKSDVSAMITSAVSSFNTTLIVPTIAVRDTLQLSSNTLVLVLDATADASVQNGAAMYVYDSISLVYHKVSEFESLDVSISWNTITGKPISSPQGIDDAVSKRHSHLNGAVLDKLSQSNDGDLMFDGKPIQAHVAVNDW